MSARTRTKIEKGTAAFRLPKWLILAIKFDAARNGLNCSQLAEAILSRGVSPESRKQADSPTSLAS